MGKSTKTSSSNKPPKWAKPYLTGAADTITGTVNANQGNLDQMAGDIRGHLPQLGEMAFGDNPGLNAASGYAQDVLGGKYLNGNSYLDAQIGQTADDVSNRVNSMFARSGASLGTQHAGIMSKELANAENQMRFGNYNQERQNQMGAAGMMPSLNASQYAGVMPYLAANQGAAQTPFAGIGNLGMLGGLFGGYGTQTQSGGGGGTGAAIASGLASALPFILSEPEAKTKITLRRRDPDGLGWYDYAYKRTPDEMVCGVMADEVERLRPWALGPRLANGWRTVNYAKLSEAA